MYSAYNRVLRQQVDPQYVTTIHAVVSGIIKLSAIMILPIDRKVYRGLSDIELPQEFWEEDEYGAKGGVELGIMSTTLNRRVACQYSSHGNVPTIFEIDVGQVGKRHASSHLCFVALRACIDCPTHWLTFLWRRSWRPAQLDLTGPQQHLNKCLHPTLLR